MDIKSIKYVSEMALLDEQKSFVHVDLHIFADGGFACMTISKAKPIQTYGILSPNKLSELNDLVQRDIFQLNQESFQREMTSSRSKVIGRLSIDIEHQDSTFDEKTQLQWDYNPLSRSVSKSLPPFFLDMMGKVENFVRDSIPLQG
jgi:hypothetical protein